MGRRAEFTLLIILGLAAIAIVLLVWGQQTGRLTIFGDTFPEQGGAPIVVTPAPDAPETILETFETTLLHDPSRTTAEWNHEAGNAALRAGLQDGLVQSLVLSDLTGAVEADFRVNESKPDGSNIYYGLSHDGGTTWTAIVPGQRLRIENAQGDWRWRAYLQRGFAGTSPVLEHVGITLTPNSK